MNDDELLIRYVDKGAQDAFALLVERYVGLVYSAALRQVRDRHDAEDVTQAVFIALARDARRLRGRRVLAGWLMTATRFLASHAHQSKTRRKRHEQRAAELANIMTTQEPNVPEWAQLAPELDEAMEALGPKARDAVLLRYFQGKSVREVAQALGISEDAAKRRLSRGLEQLRGLFARRGIAIPAAAALGVMLSAHGVQAAPPGLAAASTAVSMKFALATTLQKGTATLMSVLKTKVAIMGLAALGAVGTTGAVIHHALAQSAATPVQLAAADGAGPVGAAPAKDESWRKRFDQLYRLDDKQVLRRVPPPFIPERAAYFVSIDPSGHMFDPVEDSMTVFAWREGRAELDLWTRGAPNVGSVLGSMLGIPTYKLEMKLKDRLRPLPGDWVIRKEEPEDKKLDALAKVLQAELKWNVHFEKREAEHDVIVATGAYVKPKPDADGPGAIDVFVDGKDSHGMAAGDLNGFCRSLGELCNVEFVVEATGGKSGIFWRNHTGANLSREDADKMLANVAAQTGLTFARARRVTSHWVAVTEEKGR